MRGIARAGFLALAWSSLLTGYVAAQPANAGCTASLSAAGTQTWRCDNGITIVAENGDSGGAQFRVTLPISEEEA